MNKSTNILKPVLFTVSTIAAALASAHASAHGYMVFPQDYAYSCSVGSTNSSELCNSTVSQQKNEINQNPAGNHIAVLKDGQLCSATKGGAYGVLDVPSAQRYTTTLTPDQNGMVEIQYMPTAAHRTWYWDYFVTRDGFNPETDVLTWGDLERIDVIDAAGATPGNNNQMHHQKIHWPADKTGKRILFQIWQRPNPSHTPHDVLGAAPSNVWDSPEAFYSCANVYVAPNDGVDPDPENPWPVSERFAFDDTAIEAGYAVVARIMENGSERFKIPLEITAANLADDQWKIELAEKINSDLSASKFMQVGVRNDSDEIILNPDPDQNYIHFKQENWSHLIESHNNETPDIPYSIRWPDHRTIYEFAAYEAISIPFSVYVEEHRRLFGHYEYSAVVYETGSANPDPVAVLEGEVDNEGAPASINLNNAGTYSVNLNVTNQSGRVESALYHFEVAVDEEDSGSGDYDFVFPDGLQSYTAGTTVKASDGQIYQCKGWPASGYCQQWSSTATQFEPGTGSHWTMAWDKVN
ncbi:lytic polysaccharide monooxygenase [Vibrio fluvialis]|uniref:lytic polysaccharide monooxygenase n=1 Tax=Vibrio fluvialis TaxID=676 RepID=UPI0028DFE77B|nr:lytic polysaccharide monooxygenase [Vibrio fluvialis]MDT8869187.1 lytic polysaccharide monooxygenase [Vibrio fluvialis]MDT8876840.1 lytic polysaccharide monooxygenase [Vibrio fluvialis]